MILVRSWVDDIVTKKLLRKNTQRESDSDSVFVQHMLHVIINQDIWKSRPFSKWGEIVGLKDLERKHREIGNPCRTNNISPLDAVLLLNDDNVEHSDRV